MTFENWEMMSYAVTLIGLPLAILVFLYEQKKEREHEEEEVYQLLSDNYQDFLKTALDRSEPRFSRGGRGARDRDALAGRRPGVGGTGERGVPRNHAPR